MRESNALCVCLTRYRFSGRMRLSKRPSAARGMGLSQCKRAAVSILYLYNQYLRHLSGIDSVVNPPKCSHLGHYLINKNGIGHFRKQF